MIHVDLFSGIGGFAIASEAVWPDIEHVFCDNDPFCRAVLKKHWPTSKIYEDIRYITSDAERKRKLQSKGIEQNKRKRISDFDLLTGGFPCQPFSVAGKRRGTTDDRHLWPEMRRVIQEFFPRYVVAENVRGLLSIDGGLVFEGVCSDMEALGYEVQPFIVPACAVNAPHRRDRVWIVARHAKHDGFNGSEDEEGRYARGNGDTKRKDEDGQSSRSNLSRNTVTNPEYESERHAKLGGFNEGASNRATGSNQNASNAKRTRYARHEYKTRQDAGHNRRTQFTRWSEDWPTVAARLCRMDDGIPRRMDRNPRLKALGNSIVPQVAVQILLSIKQSEKFQTGVSYS